MTTPFKRQWRWWRSPESGRAIARDEFEALPEAGRAALYAAIRRYCQGASQHDEVKGIGGGLYELRVQVGTNPYRAIFFTDSPVHTVCVVVIYKNQRKLPKGDLERAKSRRTAWKQQRD